MTTGHAQPHVHAEDRPSRDEVLAFTPGRSCISFIQCRPTLPGAHAEDSIGRLCEVGFRELGLFDFYDVVAEERGLVRRVALSGGGLRLRIPETLDIRVAITLHVMLWSVGFSVFRVALSTNELDPEPGEGLTIDQLRTLHLLEHELGEGVDAEWTFTLGEVEHRTSGNVRRFLDYVGFLLHDVVAGRRPARPDTVSAWSESYRTGMAHAEALRDRGELAYTYPVTFGTHSEYVWVDEVPDTAVEWAPAIMGHGERSEASPHRIETESTDSVWFMGEFQSVLLRTAPASRGLSPLTSWDDNRVGLVEYIALRRGVLRVIQRETHRATAERQALTRAQVADWLWLLSAVTDDYVLAGWQAARFESIKRSMGRSRSLRNLTDLEGQVRRNVDAFQGRLDAASDRMGVIVAVLFGIVAATALVPLAQVGVGLVFRLNLDLDDFPKDYPVVYLAITAALITVMAGVGALLLRRVSLLRPPSTSPSAWRRKR